MSLEYLAGNAASQHVKVWEDWLYATSYVYDNYLRRIDISPFELNEASLVAMLASSAVVANANPLVDMSIGKHGHDGKGIRKGRSDLWVDFGEVTYSFELKRAKQMANLNNLNARLDLAWQDICKVPPSEHDHSAAMLMAGVFAESKDQILRGFASHKDVDFAFRFGPAGIGGGYLFLRMKD